jgi:hypothetical protein
MSANTIQIAARNMGMDPRITANGSYTLPQYAFIPHPALQQLSSGFVSGPMAPQQSAAFAVVPGMAGRALPTAMGSVYGIRSLQYKSSP